VSVVLPLSPALALPVLWLQVIIVLIVSKQPAAARTLVWARAQAVWQVFLQPVTCRPLGWRVSRQGQLRGLQLTGLLLQQSSHLEQCLSTCSMTDIEVQSVSLAAHNEAKHLCMSPSCLTLCAIQEFNRLFKGMGTCIAPRKGISYDAHQQPPPH
jgi:hypothetical protein